MTRLELLKIELETLTEILDNVKPNDVAIPRYWSRATEVVRLIKMIESKQE